MRFVIGLIAAATVAHGLSLDLSNKVGAVKRVKPVNRAAEAPTTISVSAAAAGYVYIHIQPIKNGLLG